LSVENPDTKFLLEDNLLTAGSTSGDALISENSEFLTEFTGETNFVTFIEQEDPGAYVRDSGVEVISSTRDSYGVTSNYLLSITENVDNVSDPISAIITKDVNITESGVTPADLGSAVYTGLASSIETITPADLNTSIYTGLASSIETITPADLGSAVYTGPAAVVESAGTSNDIEVALTFKLATTTGQSTGFVRVVYGNTQISTFSKDTVNVFKAVQIQTMNDLDGQPRLVLVTSPDIGRNLDRQANGNFGNGTIISSTRIKIIPVGGANTNLFTVSTIYSNNFLTLTSDYIPTTANAELYWGS
jgi:hypothetical protein